MSMRKPKSAAKLYSWDLNELQLIVKKTMTKVSGIVGNSLGPGGRNVIIESDLIGIGNKNTKDGVSIFRALGANDPYEHLIIEQVRDAAVKTVNEAGDGTTTATVISASLINNLFDYCNKNRKVSPQKVVRSIQKTLNNKLIPEIQRRSIKITPDNTELLEKVATISSNGDKDMASSVIKAFELTGFSSASHVTIQELSGPSNKYEVSVVEGFPIYKGYEESAGRYHTYFINDQANQRCVLEKPLFILFDGKITDLVQIVEILNKIGKEYVNGNSEYKNVVLVAHQFSDTVLANLANNFQNELTINVFPLVTPMDQLINSQLHFLMDLSAFTGAGIFDMTHPISEAIPEDFGKNMEKIEISRFRSTVVGDPEPFNVETRAGDLKKLSEQSGSRIESMILEERIGKLTSGIAQLKVYGSSLGELKEKIDRAEDSVCAVRSAITSGCLPGGCRILIDLAEELLANGDEIDKKVLVPSLMSPFYRLYDNAGYDKEEVAEILEKLKTDKDLVYDIENMTYGKFQEMGVFDATPALTQALTNALSISSVMGTLGGLICQPRDNQFERQSAQEEIDFRNEMAEAEKERALE